MKLGLRSSILWSNFLFDLQNSVASLSPISHLASSSFRIGVLETDMSGSVTFFLSGTDVDCSEVIWASSLGIPLQASALRPMSSFVSCWNTAAMRVALSLLKLSEVVGLQHVNTLARMYIEENNYPISMWLTWEIRCWKLGLRFAFVDLFWIACESTWGITHQEQEIIQQEDRKVLHTQCWHNDTLI